ncbi:MAG: family 20 glycosylhydrolase [Clostridia bacterium]|nr:family 20 glycosylhydrolase [Clostridia bacterium]
METIKREIFNVLKFNADIEISYEDYNGVKLSYDGKKAVIGYNSKTNLARGYFLLAKNLSSSHAPFTICQERRFKTMGVSLDVSRGGVPEIKALKKFVAKMAALGYNFLKLYMEDMFKMDDYPRFGYMRGRYSAEELKELDDYAYSLGVEIVPSVEMLSHMEQYFQWDEAAPLTNGTRGTFLVESEKTYEFLENVIKHLRGIFRTNRICPNMDEAEAMFVGKYQKLHGIEVNKMEVFLKHSKRVIAICEKYGFRPITEGDMYFRLASKKGQYYDLDVEFPKELLDSIPKNVDMTAWLYSIPAQFEMEKRGLTPEECHRIFMEKYRQLCSNCLYLGGIWSWDGFFEDSGFSLDSMLPAMKNCLKMGFEEVIVSSWGDGGQEANLLLQLPGMLTVYSEYCYNGLDCTMEQIADASTYLTGLPFENRMNLMRRLHGSDPSLHDCQRFNNSLFYGDIFYNLVDLKYDYEAEMKAYTEGAELCRKYMADDPKNADYYRFCLLSFEIGIMKMDIFENLRTKYRENDMDYLKKVTYEYIPKIIENTKEFYKIFQSNWDETNKPFGSEIHQIRLGGVVNRAEYVAGRLDKYIKGEIEKIEELDQDIVLSKGRSYNHHFHKVTTSSAISY